MRRILLHCHFFKNAGSSIDWALLRCFGDSLYDNKEHFYSVFDWDNYLVSLLKENQTINAITSHIFTVIPPDVQNVEIYPITMYRHPIERVTSVAAYEKKQKYRNSFGTITDEKIGICDYVEAYMKKGTPATIRNMHTLRFAGRDNGLPVGEKDFRKAVDTVEQIPTIGLVQKFDESMVLFEENLKPIFPNLDLAYIKQNVYQKPATIEERLQNLRSQLGDDIYGRICAENDFDLRLYKVVQAIFASRLQSINNFEQKLASFRQRCCELQKCLVEMI